MYGPKAEGLGINRILVEEGFPNQVAFTDMRDIAEKLAQMFR